MIEDKESREKKDLRRVMSQLELTAKNQAIAEQYLDLSKPEDADLLKEVEHQNFQKLERNARSELNQFLEACKEGNAELVFSGDGIVLSDMDVVVYEVHFEQTVTSKVSIEGAVTGEALRLAPCKLGEVDPRYFSETVLQLKKATASSKERQPYPDCKRQYWY